MASFIVKESWGFVVCFIESFLREMRTNGVGDGIILGTTARRADMFGTGERIGFLFYDEESDGGG